MKIIAESPKLEASETEDQKWWDAISKSCSDNDSAAYKYILVPYLSFFGREVFTNHNEIE